MPKLRWRIVAVKVEDAQEHGTGTYEPFAVVKDGKDDLILCKSFVEDEDDAKSTVVQGGLGKEW